MAPSVLMMITFKKDVVVREVREVRDLLSRELHEKVAELEAASGRIESELAAGRYDVPHGVALLLDHLQAAGLATPALVKRLAAGELHDERVRESPDDLKRPATA